MSTRFRKLSLIFKTLGELGPRQVWHFATYQIGLRSGYYRWRSPPRNPAYIPVYPVHLDKIPLPKVDALLDVLDVPARQDLDTLADELRSGKVRLFGGPPVALRLSPPGPLQHWTAYESQLLNPDTGEAEDIKWIWEPSRCIWGIQWGRTAYLSGSARDSAVFWEYVGQFWTANPPNMGPNWSSAQEIALRLISLCLAARSFSELQPLRPEESDLLSRIVASHADRLPLTLSYARAQNNNHLLAEAAGLYTAGILLPEHPQADRWRDSGWKWFNRGLQTQIAGDGSYIQNSANYHRLMLQLALWVNLLAASRDEKLPSPTRDKLAASTRWLLELVDPDTGSVPNLGANDGAYLFPLTPSSYADYRPVLQAASRAFLGKPAFPAGSWDEMSGWLVPDRPGPTNFEPDTVQGTGLLVLRPSNIPTWAYLRAAHFTDRPGHADQLHLDLWWRGWNIAGDAGTILYNASPPWNNALARTAAHNTLVVAGQDQMTHAGRFLWLDRAQAKVLEYQSVPVNNNIWAVAQHDGYRKMGLIHRRKVGWDGTGWLVEDEVFAQAGQPSNRMISVSMHWLLPDCTWQLLTETPLSMRLQTPAGWVNMNIETTAGEELEPGQVSMQLARAGQLVFGDGQVEPTSGWRSHTYGYKEPALSFRYGLRGQLPLRLTTRWDFLPIITPHPPMQAALTN